MVDAADPHDAGHVLRAGVLTECAEAFSQAFTAVPDPVRSWPVDDLEERHDKRDDEGPEELQGIFGVHVYQILSLFAGWDSYNTRNN